MFQLYTSTSLTVFAVLVCLCIYLPDDNLAKVEALRWDVSDKWLFINNCAICWEKNTVKFLCLTHQNQIPSYCAKIIFTKVEGDWCYKIFTALCEIWKLNVPLCTYVKLNVPLCIYVKHTWHVGRSNTINLSTVLGFLLVYFWDWQKRL